MKHIAAAAVFLLAGCVSISDDARFTPVEEAVKSRTGADTKWPRTADEAGTIRGRVRELLAKPLGPTEAVQVALLNNPGLQASYAEVGIAEADLVQASRWRGPTFSFARLRRGGETEIERGVFFDVLGLLSIPLSTKASEYRLVATQNRAASDGLRIALEARKAWFQAVAAQETVAYLGQVRESAEASAELARRMAGVGNFPKLTHAREQAFYAEATTQLARARHNATAARERLARLLGLWGSDLAFRLPERLPDLPKGVRDSADLEAMAIAQRLDVQAARSDARALAESLGLTEATRFVSLLEAGVLSNSETGQPRQRGWEVEISIPLFDFGQARLARAERQYMQAVNRATEVAVAARSEVREAYSAYRSAFDIAKHYRDEIVPLRKLADSREQVAAANGYIESLRDFWIADADLQMTLTGGSPGVMRSLRTAAPADAAGKGH
jgi:outer membrane protein TolC